MLTIQEYQVLASEAPWTGEPGQGMLSWMW